MRILYLIIALVLYCQLSAAQLPSELDKVTLNNGEEHIGYIIEQMPGKHIKLYRPEENDTLTVTMEDITKLNKLISGISKKKKVKDGSGKSEDTPKND